jgi:proteasome lid subunit RPN8/RPN11
MLAEEEEGRDADGDGVPGGAPASPLIPDVRRRRDANDICELGATLSYASSTDCDCTPATDDRFVNCVVWHSNPHLLLRASQQQQQQHGRLIPYLLGIVSDAGQRLSLLDVDLDF